MSSAMSRLRREAYNNHRVKVLSTPHPIIAAAQPYEVLMQEDMATYGVNIILLDSRRENPARMVVKVPASALEPTSTTTLDVMMKAVMAAKRRLQKTLSESCNEPELRLWAAENREVDLMDNSEIPSRIRIAYNKYLKYLAAVEENERLDGKRRRRVVEVPVEADSGPVGETPRPRKRRVVKRTATPITTNESSEEKEDVPVKTVKGARPKTPIRKPRCQNRDHDEPPEMEFKPEEGLWRCAVPGCKMKARPKSDAPVAKVTLGKGSLDFRVMFPDPGTKPSILLVSDNNIAIDVTDYVDMENFLKYSRVVQRAQDAAKQGEKIVTVTLSDNRNITALLRFKSMKVYGCDNA